MTGLPGHACSSVAPKPWSAVGVALIGITLTALMAFVGLPGRVAAASVSSNVIDLLPPIT
jgi:hypothetical protein